MAIEERKLTPAGQGNLQQIKLGIPVCKKWKTINTWLSAGCLESVEIGKVKDKLL